MSDIEKVERALAQAIDSGDKALANEYADLLETLGRQQTGRKNTKDYGALNALRHGLQQGATFGFADEISATARAGLDKLFGGKKYGGDFGDLYRMYRDDERAQIEGGREHHGGKMLAAEFVPGLLQGGAGIGRATGKATAREALEAAGQAKLRDTWKSMAGTGAAYGGAAGLGYGDADLTRGEVGGALGQTAGGAALGGALGVGLPAAMTAVGRAGKSLQRPFRRFGRDQEAAEEAAKRKILRDLKRDGVTPERAEMILRENPHYYLADVGGEQSNLGDSLEHIMQFPGAGRTRLRDSLTERQKLTFDRMMPFMREQLEASADTTPGMKMPKNYEDILVTLKETARNQARPLYQKAYRTNDQFRPTKYMLDLVKKDDKGRFVQDVRRGSPLIEKADKEARAAIQDRVLSREISQAEADATFQSRYFDELQRALRDKISSTGAKAKSARQTRFKNIHRELVNEMKTKGVYPEEWQAARTLWRGTKAAEEAFNEGQKIFSGHIGKHKGTFKQYRASGERDHYLMGALTAIEDKLMRGGELHDLFRTLRTTKRGEEMIKLIFGGEKGYQRWLRASKKEVRMLDTFQRMAKGSATYGRAAKGGEMAEAAGTIGGLTSNISGLPWLTRLAAKMGRNEWIKRDEQTRNIMADLLLTRDPKQLELVEMLQKQQWGASPKTGLLSLSAATQLPGLLD